MFRLFKKKVKAERNKQEEIKKEIEEENLSSFDLYVDCKGIMCPKPIFEISKKIREMKMNEILKVDSDDPAFEKDIKGWSKVTGNEIIGESQNENIFIVYLKKS